MTPKTDTFRSQFLKVEIQAFPSRIFTSYKTKKKTRRILRSVVQINLLVNNSTKTKFASSHSVLVTGKLPWAGELTKKGNQLKFA